MVSNAMPIPLKQWCLSVQLSDSLPSSVLLNSKSDSQNEPRK